MPSEAKFWLNWHWRSIPTKFTSCRSVSQIYYSNNNLEKLWNIIFTKWITFNTHCGYETFILLNILYKFHPEPHESKLWPFLATVEPLKFWPHCGCLGISNLMNRKYLAWDRDRPHATWSLFAAFSTRNFIYFKCTGNFIYSCVVWTYLLCLISAITCIISRISYLQFPCHPTTSIIGS